jgi:hypothetical protein
MSLRRRFIGRRPVSPTSSRHWGSPKLVEPLENRLLFASDFGDAPASYGTLLADNGPSHVLGSGLFLGAAVDSEADGLPSVNADGDDTTGGTPDDEDGVTLGSLVAGEASTAQVVVHLPGGVSSARLSAWVDWNGNGSFLDDTTAASAVVVTNGSNNVTINVPAGAVPGPTFARFRLSSIASLGPQGAGPDGEVEDYAVTINPGTDFGDAPNGYGTFAANSGASHTRLSGLYLGAGVDGETDGQPSTGADGDDTHGTDDEDGVTFSNLVNNSNASATVVVHLPGGTASARLCAWIDWNGNGTFNDDLPIANGVVVTAGSNNLPFFVPSNGVTGPTYARFRLSPTTTSSPVGAASGGEVEDYLIRIAPVAWVSPESQATWNPTLHTLTVTGDATIIDDPTAALNALNNVTGAAAVLHVTPAGGAGGVINLSTVNVTGGGSMIVSPRSVTGGLTTIVIRPPAGSSAGGPPNVDATSTFDLTDNAMVLKSATAALSTLQTSLRNGFNAGGWNGAGGISSSSAAVTSTGTAIGFGSNGVLNETSSAGVTGLGATDVLVKFTYSGDANLDGQVDITDLGLLSGNWQQSGKDWLSGDFTYDGIVNIGDLGALAGNWQKGVGNPI